MTFDMQSLYQIMSRSSTIVPVEESKQEEPTEEPAPAEEQPAPVVEEPQATEETQPVTEEPTSNAEQPAEGPVVAEQAAIEETKAEEPKAAPKKKPTSTVAKKCGAKSQNKK